MRLLEVHHTAAGKRIQCSHCRRAIVVPGQPAPEPKARRAPAPPPPPRGAAAPRPRPRIKTGSQSGLFGLLLFLVLLAGAAAAGGIYVYLSEEERLHEPVIREGFEEMVAAVNAGDAARLARLLDAAGDTQRTRMLNKYETYFKQARMTIVGAKIHAVKVDRGVAEVQYSLTQTIENRRTGNRRDVTKERAKMQWRLEGDAWFVFEEDLDFVLPD